MRLATSKCNPAKQERRNITDAFLRTAVPMCFVTTGCNPAAASHQIGAATTMWTSPCLSFFYVFFFEIELSLQSCAPFVNNFPRSRPAPAVTETLYFSDPWSHITRKKTWFRALECFHLWNSHAPTLLHLPIPWWCTWHNGVVDMMVWC